MTSEVLHFIRPEWLMLVPPIILVWYFLKRLNAPTSWENYLPQAMLSVLRVKSPRQRDSLYWCLLTLWLGLILAAAGPSWIKQTIPTVQNQNAMVIVLDLSPSMLAQDIKPDRLTRAKYELQDILNQLKDSQIALVAYSGSAHTVSPLTDDSKTLATLLPALSPRLMPQQGSHLESAIELAQQLLTDAGVSGGDILLITDGVTQQAAQTVRGMLKTSRSLSILAVASTNPTPIPAEGGGFLRNQQGEIILAELTLPTLQNLVQNTGGQFSMLTADDADTRLLIQGHRKQLINNNQTSNDDTAIHSDEFDDWVDKGYWLILLILPFALLCFRKGVIYCLPFYLLATMMFASKPLKATELEQQKTLDSPSQQSTRFSWRDLFTSKDQQAAKLMQKGDYQAAANRFKQDEWSAIAHYRNGNYAKTIEKLNSKTDIRSLYNKGNALALKGEIEKAIETYEAVLALDVNHEDAIHNKQVLEEFMLQQQNSQQTDQLNKSEKASKQENNKQSEQQNQPKQDQQKQGELASQSDTDQSSKSEQKSSSNGGEQTSEKESFNESESRNGNATNDNEDTKALSAQSKKQADEQSQAEQATPPLMQNNSAPESSEKESDEELAKHKLENNVLDKQTNSPVQQINESDSLPETQRTPLADSSEQWLRSIQDDPSGLLRRKFEYQMWQRAQQKNQNSASSSVKEERY